ncbi:MAG: isochorismatase family protein [Planctomycetota bacterium]|nr:isochorismatase family protein [Planctomycetota bacterium]
MTTLSDSLIAAITIVAIGLVSNPERLRGDDLNLKLRSQHRENGVDSWKIATESEKWDAKKTAVIVCDVWDKHHCLNAVRRLEEFAPRMNDVLKEARRRGATIIHSPSDCMAAYEDHSARKRAMSVPRDMSAPADVEFWCSKIPSEEQAAYPIDQSDGGEDDNPEEHAKWAAELTQLGRNLGMPWKTQSPLIEIDEGRDFISDKGDEVWNILQSSQIENVILVGVHTNMCVLGRPFGLRQMVRNGKRVVLMRDMTDCMYNPKRWPFVDHFSGNELVLSHVERYVCPTVTSDQILGGDPFRSKYDVRLVHEGIDSNVSDANESTFQNRWTTARLDSSWKELTNGKIEQYRGIVWIRCTVRLPKVWLAGEGCNLKFATSVTTEKAWLNGVPLTQDASDSPDTLVMASDSIVPDDINLLVIRMDSSIESDHFAAIPSIISGRQKLPLRGRWQFRFGDAPAWSNIPLPAKFGMGSDVLFEPR